MFGDGTSVGPRCLSRRGRNRLGKGLRASRRDPQSPSEPHRSRVPKRRIALYLRQPPLRCCARIRRSLPVRAPSLGPFRHASGPDPVPEWDPVATTERLWVVPVPLLIRTNCTPLRYARARVRASKAVPVRAPNGWPFGSRMANPAAVMSTSAGRLESAGGTHPYTGGVRERARVRRDVRVRRHPHPNPWSLEPALNIAGHLRGG